MARCGVAHCAGWDLANSATGQGARDATNVAQKRNAGKTPVSETGVNRHAAQARKRSFLGNGSLFRILACAYVTVPSPMLQPMLQFSGSPSVGGFGGSSVFGLRALVA